MLDDDVSYWTAALDQRLTGSQFIPAIAAGNSGLMDPTSGLNRIQPPGDAINALSIGAADRTIGPWREGRLQLYRSRKSTGLGETGRGCFWRFSEPAVQCSCTQRKVKAGLSGTSFASAAVLALISGGVDTTRCNRVTSLAVRALMVHRAQDDENSRLEVGWGKFEVDPDLMVTCPDDEPLIIYRGITPCWNSPARPCTRPGHPFRGHGDNYCHHP